MQSINPFRQLVYWRIMPEAKRLVKSEHLAEFQALRATVTFLSQRHHPLIHYQAGKGFIYFKTLQLMSKHATLMWKRQNNKRWLQGGCSYIKAS